MTVQIFPQPQWLIEGDEAILLNRPLTLSFNNPVYSETVNLLRPELESTGGVELSLQTPSQVWIGGLDDEPFKQALEGRQIPVQVRRPGGYGLLAGKRGIFIGAADPAGAFYGAQTFLQAIQPDGTIPSLFLCDWPYKPLRGMHFYLPGRDQILFFKRLLYQLASLKYNTIYLEIGGGMRYDRHPEINQAWEKFTRQATAFPGGPVGLQESLPFAKDSTHTELAGGKSLEKEEICDLLNYAQSLHLEVIPEVQSLSHAYYLCIPHPEIAERSDDPWPDTYCPSNPKSYELLFDVMEEVIQVFKPKVVHVGHDEVYHLGICPRCKGKSGHELLGGDLHHIHAFLAERGIRMGMWGDKILPAHREDQGGTESTDPRRPMPATFKAIEGLPRDIMISEWLGNSDPFAAKFFLGKGFEVVAGNFGDNFFAHRYLRWNERSTEPGLLGGEVPTWCDVSEFALAYNGCLFNLMFSAEMLWWSHYRDMERDGLCQKISARMPAVRAWLHAGAKKPDGMEFTPLLLREAGEPPSFTRRSGLRIDRASSEIHIPVGMYFDAFEFEQACETDFQRTATYYLTNPYQQPQENLVATYRLQYQDGTTEDLPIYYGWHVARWDVPYGEHVDAVPYWADPMDAGREPGGRRVTLYRCTCANPKPGLLVKSIQIVPAAVWKGVFWLFALKGGRIPIS